MNYKELYEGYLVSHPRMDITFTQWLDRFYPDRPLPNNP
jgi:hypothetical protein